MKRLLIALAAGLLLAAPVAAPAMAREDASNVVDVSREDPEVNAAKAEARRHLARFWTRYEADPEVRRSASLKVEFVQGESTEAMWVGDVERGPGGVITGILNNEPVAVTNVKSGDRVTVDPGRIMDWTYARNGKAWGHFTTRVLLKRVPADQAAQYDGYFSDTPVEP